MKKQTKVNQTAVENFLGSLDIRNRKSDNLDNAFYDYKLYDWSLATLIEITRGIEKAYNEKKMGQV